jgi:putative membrane protein
MIRLLGYATLGLAVLTLQAAAYDTGGQQITDEQFVQKASAAGLAEVNMAKMALQNASRDDVKQFAKRVIEDHTKANRELNRIADAKRFTPAASMDGAHETMATRMSRLTGADFDREYMRNQVKDHEQAVALFEAESKNGRDPQLKEFATKTLPTLREHLETAQKIAGEKGTGRSGTGTRESRPRD